MRRLEILLISLFPIAAPGLNAQEFNVILIVLDTVRADHTTPYGYSKNTTPALAELAKKGAVFERASSQSNWTLPAFISMFTGERPGTHGISMVGESLSPEENTLAEIYQRHGYKTAAFTNRTITYNPYAVSRGFETWQTFVDRDPGSLALSMPPALKWLERHSREPFFLLIHGAGAHTPYACPKKDISRFAAEYEKTSDRFDLYDGCLHSDDNMLFSLYRTMSKRGLWENTILVATSDHGEEFGEHGGVGHFGRPMHEEISHVPFLLYHPGLPGLAGRRIDAPLEQIDLLPTLLNFEGWRIPSGVEGRSFARLLSARNSSSSNGATDSDLGQYSQATSTYGVKTLDMEAFRMGDWKIVRNADVWEFFDLAQDPAEKRNLIESKPEIFLNLAKHMMEFKLRGLRSGHIPARGVGSTLIPASSPWITWANAPKDSRNSEIIREIYKPTPAHDPSEEELKGAALSLVQFPIEERLKLVREMTQTHPGNIGMQESLAQAYWVDGDSKRAVDILETLLKAHVGQPSVRLSVGRIFLQWNMPDKTVPELLRVIERSNDPDQYLAAYETLLDAPSTLGRAEPSAHEEEWRQKIASGLKDLKFYQLMARSYRLHGDQEALGNICKAAIKLFPNEKFFYANLADVYRHDGDFEALETLYGQEVESVSYPDARDYIDWANVPLGLGYPGRAKEILERGLKDGRLSAREIEELRFRFQALSDVSVSYIASQNDQAPCRYPEDRERIWIECGGSRLDYSLETEEFTLLPRSGGGPVGRKESLIAELRLEDYERHGAAHPGKTN